MSYKYQRNFNTEEYDRELNLFYLSIHPKVKKLMGGNKTEEHDLTRVSNVLVYDVVQQSSKVLLEEVEAKEVITHLLFETTYDEEKQAVTFNRHSSKIQNDHGIEKRPLKDRLLICQENTDTHHKKLWMSKKDGSSKKLLAELDAGEEWRLDVYNGKVRTFRRSEENAMIRDYDW